MSWVEKSLGEVLKLEYGKPLDKSLRKEGGKYPAYGANGIKAWSDEYFHDEETIVVGRKGSAGELTLTEGKFWPLDVTYFVKTNKNDYDIKFLYYLLLSLDLPSLATGVKPGINRNNVYKIQAKFPSYSKQKQVAGQLDKAFADIEQVRANTEKNLQNARELFDSYLQQVFSERGEGWKKIVFSDLCEITSKLVDPRESEFLDYPHIGAANITSVTGELTEIKTAREEQLKSGKFVFDESMVLYSKIRPYLMKTCRPNFVGLCSADIYPLVPNKELITRDFLFYLLTTQHFTDYAISGSSRAGMPKVNRTHLFNYTCHIPSVEEQDMLVEKLNLMMEKSEELQGIYQSKLAALDELKQSLLQQAFTGQLTQG